ncbi:MAG: hypothetical protein KAR11_05620 [Phycisphaerae bacterium]|nr:hypothetical protein [Phycisphaerae bacterium]
MRFFCISITLVLTLAFDTGLCIADTSVTLEPSLKQNADVYPYRSATLVVKNDTGKPVAAVELRDSLGGPRMIFPAVIAPETSARVDVHLPAISLVQNYNVRLLADDNANSAPLVKLQTQISWPPDLITHDAFFDPQVYERYEESTFGWSNDAKLKAFVLLGIAGVCMAGVLLIRNAWVRAVLLVAVIAAACIVDLTIRTQPFEIVTDPQGLTIFTTRETFSVDSAHATSHASQQKIADALRNTAPVYPALWAYSEEDMIVHPTKGLSFTARPEQMRVFRELGTRD